MHLVFVYGSLKKGFNNHRLIKDCKFEQATAPDIELHDGPGFPFAKRGNGVTHGELYEVDDETLSMLDCLEGHPTFYKREKTIVKTDSELKDAWIYLYKKAASYPKIESGMWS